MEGCAQEKKERKQITRTITEISVWRGEEKNHLKEKEEHRNKMHEQ